MTLTTASTSSIRSMYIALIVKENKVVVGVLLMCCGKRDSSKNLDATDTMTRRGLKRKHPNLVTHRLRVRMGVVVVRCGDGLVVVV